MLSSSRIARSARSWLVTSYPIASSTDAFTGLSYTAICGACAPQYRTIQISPHVPSASRHSQQPTCPDEVIPFPAPPHADLHRFTANRVYIVTYAPVSVSPNPTQSAARGLGRRRDLHPPAPFVAVPAQLRAYGFGTASVTIGDRDRLPILARNRFC